MDEPGWHARQNEYQYYHSEPLRNPDGSYIPRVQVAPLNAPFAGYNVQHGIVPFPDASPAHHQSSIPSPSKSSTFQSFAPPPGPPPAVTPPMPVPQSYHTAPWMPDGNYRAHSVPYNQPGLTTGLTAAQRANSYLPMARMDPHLQFLCGPLLRYDTIVNGVWQGACMIVTADAGSVYEPHPFLTVEYDPHRPVTERANSSHFQRQFTLSVSGAGSDHPIDTYGGSLPHTSPVANTPLQQHRWLPSEHARSETIHAQELWVYHGPTGSCTFWRWPIRIPLTQQEMGIRYRINGGQELEFFVPALHQNMRLAAYSCNGFTIGINQEEFKGPGHASGFDPLWTDLMQKHAEQPIHALIGGGDQLYCDALMHEPELQEYAKLKTPAEKLAYRVSDQVKHAIERFYFSHYCLSFRNGWFAKANSQIPMINMLDDHDIIDGYGSYPADLQKSELFQLIGDRGYFYFLLFQCFMVSPVNPAPNDCNQSLIVGGPGAWIPYTNHSFLTSLGPNAALLMLDCRSERTIQQVCSETTYRIIFDRLWQLPTGQIQHLVIQLGIPIAYPRMNFMETALDSPLNPLIALGKANKLGLGSAVNKFNMDAELLDDLNDHWTASAHKKERNWFVEQLQSLAWHKRFRITFISGDVHCAAVGAFKTLTSPGTAEVDPRTDWRYMLNVVSSAIVNAPPPAAILASVSILSERKHKTMHYCQTDETMIPMFSIDTNGTPLKNKNILGRRNYTIISYEPTRHDLIFDIRVEQKKGVGTTVGYPIAAPPPLWSGQ